MIGILMQAGFGMGLITGLAVGSGSCESLPPEPQIVEFDVCGNPYAAVVYRNGELEYLDFRTRPKTDTVKFDIAVNDAIRNGTHWRKVNYITQECKVKK